MTAGLSPVPSARTYAALSLGVAALTLYGSLVPFEYRPRPFSDAVHAFDWVLHNRTTIQSRGDGAANVLLGFPLGFCFLAAVRVDRTGTAGTIGTAFLLLPLCLAFASCAEFAQLWFPNRTSSATDILAQGLGAATGMVLWILFGQRLTDWVRGAWATSRFGGRAGRILLLYLVVLVAIQVLPFDVTTNPGDLARQLRQDHTLTLRPFAEWGEITDPVKRTEKVVAWLRLVGVFLPAGVLIARLPGYWGSPVGWPVVFAAAVGIGLSMELLQVPIKSRHASVTDVILESGAILLGWAGGVSVIGRCGPGGVFGFAAGWTALLVAAGWYPFDFDALAINRITAANLIPFAAVETKQYLLLLNEVMEVVVLYGPLGAAAAGLIRTAPVRVGVAAAVAVAVGIEVGQCWLTSRTPATTDVLLAALGGGIGADVWRRLTDVRRDDFA